MGMCPRNPSFAGFVVMASIWTIGSLVAFGIAIAGLL